MSIRISGYDIGEVIDGSFLAGIPNSVGGVSVGVSFTNTSAKTIKYVHFSFTPKNGVNDTVSCQIRGYSQANLTYTGPLQPNQSTSPYWENVWYNKTIKSIIPSGGTIVYMDGTTEPLLGQQMISERKAAVEIQNSTNNGRMIALTVAIIFFILISLMFSK